MREHLDHELKAAMVSRDQDRLMVLRSLKSDLKYREVELNRPMTPDEDLAVCKKAVKSREQAIELYVQGNRPELAEKERREISVIREFIPAEPSGDEIAAMVDAAIAEVQPSGMKDLGLVMKKVMEMSGGKLDGKTVNALVRSRLGG